jgi:hypothetical protein
VSIVMVGTDGTERWMESQVFGSLTIRLSRDPAALGSRLLIGPSDFGGGRTRPDDE